MNYDPWQHAEQEHITITTHPLPPELHGLWLPTHQTILLAPTLTPTMERCVLAHELAHATLGHTHTHGTNATRVAFEGARLAQRGGDASLSRSRSRRGLPGEACRKLHHRKTSATTPATNHP